jgi:Ca-activated chloride channel family protein
MGKEALAASWKTMLAVGLLLGLGVNVGRAVAEESRKDPAPGDVEWKVEASHNSLPAAGQIFFVRLRLKAPEIKQAQREPLNLSLVLDRSASMNIDSKIGFARKAAHLAADNLTPHDFVSLVAYNHEVQLLVPMHPVVNREYLHHRIDELTAIGDTNISGGFLEGCAQLEKRLAEPGQHHVILLTDGLANRGVSDVNGLVAIVQRAKERGIGLTTIGVGTDFNESLLTKMAQAGGGHYVYVSNPDQIPTAVEKELGALLAVSAQNVKLKLKVPPGVEILQVYGHEEAFQPGVLEEPLGDLTSGEERRLLIKLRTMQAVAPADVSSAVLRAEVSYDNLAAANRSKSEQVIDLSSASAASKDSESSAAAVLAYAQLVEDVDKIALAVRSMDEKLAGEVLQIREQQFPALKKIADGSHDQDFVNKAYMFEHFSRELGELIEDGALHDHSAARAQLQKDLHYRRYMQEHHRDDHQHNH